MSQNETPCDRRIRILSERIGGALRPVGHWIPGNSGNVFLAEYTDGRPATVLKCVGERELRLIRDILPPSSIPTPSLVKWWPSESDLPAIVELERIPVLAVAEPTFHFAPFAFRNPDLTWQESWLNEVVEALARVHRTFRGNLPSVDLCRTGPVQDLVDYGQSLLKLSAARDLPGGKHWLSFWADRVGMATSAFDRAHTSPPTWIWGDAKWDHVGRRSDGSLVFLEWVDFMGPGGSDLFFLVFQEASRREELIGHYASLTAQDEREVRFALLRSCFIHGPGLSCLSIRGVAGGGSSSDDLKFWSEEAKVVSEILTELGV